MDDFSDDDERLKALGEKLKSRDVERETEGTARSASGASNMALGMKYASEFAGAVIVTTFVGYFIDRFTGSSPWGLLGGLTLGTAAGVYTIVRSARNGMD